MCGMSCEFLSLVPVNRQSAVVASCPRVLEGRGIWKKHIESKERTLAKKNIDQISRAMYLWIKNHKERGYDKLGIINLLTAHFKVRFSLCRLIVNQWGERRLTQLLGNRSKQRKPAKRKTRSPLSS